MMSEYYEDSIDLHLGPTIPTVIPDFNSSKPKMAHDPNVVATYQNCLVLCCCHCFSLFHTQYPSEMLFCTHIHPTNMYIYIVFE